MQIGVKAYNTNDSSSVEANDIYRTTLNQEQQQVPVHKWGEEVSRNEREDLLALKSGRIIGPTNSPSKIVETSPTCNANPHKLLSNGEGPHLIESRTHKQANYEIDS